MNGGTCPRCGGQLWGAGLRRACPICLLRLAGPEPPGPEGSVGPPRRVLGDYELVEELARGGMGVVFRARQLSLQREVAIKLIRDSHLASASLVRRFRIEAEAASALDHPGIVPIYDVGEHEGQHYFAMKLVLGGTLADWFRVSSRGDGSQLTVEDWRRRIRRGADILVQVSKAVHHAHQRGVLHRDLKPTNILMDADARPWVTDFGLAKLGDEDATLSLAILGSPSYMAPEQAAGRSRDVSTVADVYSLGAILYELLVGRPPFGGSSPAEVIRCVLDDEPVSPRRLNPAVDRDLETICLRCLGKEPGSRYDSAAALGAELERWLEGRPIEARRTTWGERSVRWARRNPALAAVTALLAIALIVGGLMLSVAFSDTRRALERARWSEAAGKTNLFDSLMSEGRALRQAGRIGQRDKVLAAMEKAAAIEPNVDVRSEVAAALAKVDFRVEGSVTAHFRENCHYAFTKDLSQFLGGTYEADPTAILRSSADGKEIRLFPNAKKPGSWFHLRRTLFNADESRFVAFYKANVAEVWSTNGIKPDFSLSVDGAWGEADFSADGRELLAYDREYGLFIHEFATGERRLWEPPLLEPRFIRVSPQGDRVAILRDGEITVHRYPEGEPLWTVSVDAAVPWLAWAPDGRLLAAASDRAYEILIFDAASGLVDVRLAGHGNTPRSFEFHPTEAWLLSGADDGMVRLWDVRSGSALLTTVIGNLTALQFSADGTRLSVGTGVGKLGTAELVRSSVFREFRRPHVRRLDVCDVALSQSSRFIVSATVQGMALWDTAAGQWLQDISFGGDGRRRLVYAPRVYWGRDEREIIYQAPLGEVWTRSFSGEDRAGGQPAAIRLGEPISTRVKTGAHLGTMGTNGEAWIVLNGTNFSGRGVELLRNGSNEGARIVAMPRALHEAELSPDQRWCVCLCSETRDRLEVWDARDAKRLKTLNQIRFRSGGFSPDGRWFVGGGEGGHFFWETDTWQQVAHFPGGYGAKFAMSAKAGILALDNFRAISLYSWPEGRLLVRLESPFPMVAQVLMMNHDGTRLWMHTHGDRVFEWNLEELRRELARRGLDWEPDVAGPVRDGRSG